MRGMFKTASLKYKYREADKRIGSKNKDLLFQLALTKKEIRTIPNGMTSAFSREKKAKSEDSTTREI